MPGTSACGRCTASSASRPRTGRWSAGCLRARPAALTRRRAPAITAGGPPAEAAGRDDPRQVRRLGPGQHPPGRGVPGVRRMLAVLCELAGRGIVHAVATRNPPEAAAYAAGLAGLEFAAAECGWDSKSGALRRIIASLGLAADAVAFVDDDLYERAEVARALPEVMVLSPEDMADAASWPEFSPDVVTGEARRRGEMYLQRRRRLEEARQFAGSREEFLRYCRTRMIIAPAAAPDAARLHELSVRTHQFN